MDEQIDDLLTALFNSAGWITTDEMAIGSGLGGNTAGAWAARLPTADAGPYGRPDTSSTRKSTNTMSDNKPQHVYKAIAAVTRALGRAGISKDRKNDQQGYKFRGIDDIYNALNSELAAADLCIIPRVMAREVVERMSGNNRALFYVTIHAEYDIVSAVDGSCHTASAYGEAMDSGDKATNKAMSASYKYMAMQLFCIPTEGDNDADATTHEVVARGAVFHPPAATNGNHAPVCDVCGTPGRLGKDGESYFCPKKENHDNKWYTIPSAKAGAANS